MAVSMKVSKNTSMSATIAVDGTPAVYLSASISIEGGNDSTTQSIQNRELYQANKTEIREQISAFQDAVYEAQDAMAAESAAE